MTPVAQKDRADTIKSVAAEGGRAPRRYNAATNTPSITVQPTVTPDATHDATTYFLYDRLGRLTKTTDAEGYFETYGYNAFGNRVTVVTKSNTNAVDGNGNPLAGRPVTN